jgi:hypothetical protein
VELSKPEEVEAGVVEEEEEEEQVGAGFRWEALLKKFHNYIKATLLLILGSLLLLKITLVKILTFFFWGNDRYHNWFWGF